MLNYINVVCCGEVIGYFTGDICNVSQAMYTIGYDVTDENDCKKGYENNIAAFYIDSNGKYCFHEELVELDYHPLSTKDLRNLCGMSILEFSKYLKIPYRTIDAFNFWPNFCEENLKIHFHQHKNNTQVISCSILCINNYKMLKTIEMPI